MGFPIIIYPPGQLTGNGPYYSLSTLTLLGKNKILNKPSVTLILPTLNEAANLPYVLPQIPALVDEIIVIDGNSSDNTVACARRLRPDAKIVVQDGQGKGSALRQSFELAQGDIIVTMDADCSSAPGEIPRFIQGILDGFDFAKGSRFLPGGGTSDMGRYKAIGHKALVALTNRLFGSHYTDLCYGYNAFRKEALQKIGCRTDGFEIETELSIKAWKAGLKIKEVPSYEASRKYGKGKLNTHADGWRVLKTILLEFIKG